MKRVSDRPFIRKSRPGRDRVEEGGNVRTRWPARIDTATWLDLFFGIVLLANCLNVKGRTKGTKTLVAIRRLVFCGCNDPARLRIEDPFGSGIDPFWPDLPLFPSWALVSSTARVMGCSLS